MHPASSVHEYYLSIISVDVEEYFGRIVQYSVHIQAVLRENRSGAVDPRV